MQNGTTDGFIQFNKESKSNERRFEKILPKNTQLNE